MEFDRLVLSNYPQALQTYLFRTAIKFMRSNIRELNFNTYQIITSILPSTLVDFPKSAVILYDEIRKVVREIAKEKGLKPEEINFTQRLLREKTNSNHMFIKRYLKMLVEYEYIKTNSPSFRGNRSSYSLICDEKINLIDLSRIPTPDQMERLINQKDEA